MMKGFGHFPFGKSFSREVLAFCFICKTLSRNIFYTQKMDYINFMICKKTPFISLSRCTKFYVKYKLRKCYVPKFYHNKAKKQAMEVLGYAVALTYHHFKELNYSYLQRSPQYKAGAIKA